jgi:hypothetical protein
VRVFSVVVVISGATAVLLTDPEKACEELPTALVACTVKLYVPEAEGVPLIRPVVLWMLRPAGNAPAVIVNVKGDVPFMTKPCENATL